MKQAHKIMPALMALWTVAASTFAGAQEDKLSPSLQRIVDLPIEQLENKPVINEAEGQCLFNISEQSNAFRVLSLREVIVAYRSTMVLAGEGNSEEAVLKPKDAIFRYSGYEILRRANGEKPEALDKYSKENWPTYRQSFDRAIVKKRAPGFIRRCLELAAN